MNDVEYRHPDPIKHKYISFAKSAVRILAGALLILAEVLGIVEELV